MGFTHPLTRTSSPNYLGANFTLSGPHGSVEVQFYGRWDAGWEPEVTIHHKQSSCSTARPAPCETCVAGRCYPYVGQLRATVSPSDTEEVYGELEKWYLEHCCPARYRAARQRVKQYA